MQTRLHTVITILLSMVLAAASANTIAAKEDAARVKAKKIETLKNNKDVYIGDFRVTFVVKDSTSATAKDPSFMRGGEGTDYAKSNLKASLTGVSEKVMQEITNTAYADFVDRLTAKGFTILDRAELEEIKDWRKLKTLDNPSRIADTGGPALARFGKKASGDKITFAPEGMALIKPMAGNQMPYKYGSAADKIGKPILRADYTLHFAYFGSDTDYRINYTSLDTKNRVTETLTASTSVGQGIQVTPGSTLHVTVDGGGTFTKSGFVSLKDAVVVGGDYGENLDTTSGANKAANAFSSAVGIFSGGSSSTTEISIKANPEFYALGAKKALEESNERLISALP